MNKEEKYYTRSNGERILMKDVEYTHLSNSLAKKYREIFESSDKEDFNRRINEINDIKEEMYKRINKYHDETLNKGE